MSVHLPIQTTAEQSFSGKKEKRGERERRTAVKFTVRHRMNVSFLFSFILIIEPNKKA